MSATIHRLSERVFGSADADHFSLATAPRSKRKASDPGPIVAHSPAMSALYALVDRVAQVDVPVLIVGETGAGKEVVARALHQRSLRREKPLRALNCGAMPSSLVESLLFGHEKGAFTGAQCARIGLFEQASGGTLLLDEVAELCPSAQAALLRVLETQELTRLGGSTVISVDVRVVAATHRDLDQMVREGSFRLDLLFRLNAIVLHVPSLRQRIDEIALLSQHFMRSANERLHTAIEGVDTQALERLCSYAWPGNIRELKNVIERACVLASSPVITAQDLPEHVRIAARAASGVCEALQKVAEKPDSNAQCLRSRLRAYEARLISDALERVHWNQSRAAELLDMPLRTLVRKIATHKLGKRGAEARAETAMT